VLIFMEKTLVNFSIHTIIAAPAHLSLLFFPFINIRQKHNATVTVSSHVKLLPQIIPLYVSLDLITLKRQKRISIFFSFSSGFVVLF
jgi:hypothetical protein